MKYNVTLEYTFTVEADDEMEAEEVALEEVMDYSPSAVSIDELDGEDDDELGPLDNEESIDDEDFE